MLVNLMLLLIFVFSTNLSAEVYYSGNSEIEYKTRCNQNGIRVLVKSVDGVEVNIQRLKILVNDEYRNSYCNGHTRNHYDEYGNPNNQYTNYNQQYNERYPTNMGSAILGGVVGAVGGYMLGANANNNNEKVIVNKTVIIKSDKQENGRTRYKSVSEVKPVVKTVVKPVVKTVVKPVVKTVPIKKDVRSVGSKIPTKPKPKKMSYHQKQKLKMLKSKYKKK